MSLSVFTLAHIMISLVGIAAGFGMLAGLLSGRLFRRWTDWFLTATIATSVTGFLFPFKGITPAIVVGVLSLIVLGIACYALSARKLSGRWRSAFVISAVTAQYFNVFVLVAQFFMKFPVLTQLAPTQTEPAFAVTQAAVLAAFLWLGVAATFRFRLATVEA